MSESKMTFEEIKSNKEKFLKAYGLEKLFKTCENTWDELLAIGEDYEKKRNGEYLQIIQNYLTEISSFNNVHSYRYRIKTTDSLIAKIIRKHKKVSLNDYFIQITDLLGIRILYIFKGDYLSIHQQIMEHYGSRLAETVHLKLRDGDDVKTYEDMLNAYDIKVERNKDYRSIHYTVYAKPQDITSSPKVEIQTRTIFEEGWSEINHKLVYKKETNLTSLVKATRILSELVGSCDAVGSMMKYIFDESKSADITKAERNNPALANNEDTVADAIRKFLIF